MRNYIPINGIEGVATGSVATANIPVNRRYHALKVFLSANNGAATTDPTDILDYIRIYVNGVVMRDITPAEAIAIASLNGITAAAGELPIYFSEPWRATVIGEESVSWDLFGQTKMTLELKYKTGLTAITTSIQCEFDYARNVSNGQLFLAPIKQLAVNYNATGGQYDLVTLPIRFPIQRLLLGASTGTISAVEVDRDNEKVLDTTNAQNLAYLKDHGILGTAFSFPIVFDADQQISSPLIIAKDLLVKVTSSAPNTLRALVENRANGYV